MNPSIFKFLLNIYLPFLGAGIKVKRISRDFKEIDVEMNLKWYNRNYVGTHFGGSLFSMTDPFFMIMLMNILGKDYIIWDKSSCINFVKPGKGKVRAFFRIDENVISEIKRNVDLGNKYYPEFTVNIIDEKNDVVASVKKILYIRKK